MRDEAGGCLPDAHIMDIGDLACGGSSACERRADASRGRGVGRRAGELAQLQRLDMRVDLSRRAELVAQSAFEPRGAPMRFAKAQPAIDLDVEADGEPVVPGLDRDMM